MKRFCDGSYEILVIDVDERDSNSIRVDVVVVSGPAKGETVSLRVGHLRRDALSLMGLPGTLIVRDGVPKLRVD